MQANCGSRAKCFLSDGKLKDSGFPNRSMASRAMASAFIDPTASSAGTKINAYSTLPLSKY